MFTRRQLRTQERMAPQFELKPSKGSRGGIKHVTANCSLMNNKGEKDVKVRTKEGHKCVMKMQVTDVQKPLMSVSRICDAGHRVVLLRDGGYTREDRTQNRVRSRRQRVSSECQRRGCFPCKSV